MAFYSLMQVVFFVVQNEQIYVQNFYKEENVMVLA